MCSDFQDVVQSWIIVFSFFLLCHAVLCVVLPYNDTALCVVLCRDVFRPCCPEGLIKADSETGCITALMKSVSTACTQGQLAVQQQQQHCCLPPLHTGGGQRYKGAWSVRDIEIGRDLAETSHVRLRVIKH